jgi:hypothetical protein
MKGLISMMQSRGGMENGDLGTATKIWIQW